MLCPTTEKTNDGRTLPEIHPHPSIAGDRVMGGSLEIDGFDLIACDLDILSGVSKYELHSSEDREIKVLVILEDGRRFMLTAEELLS